VLVKVDSEKCTLCKLCVEYCPAYVFVVQNSSVKADSSRCIECYGCIPLCPVQAIAIEVLEGALVDFATKSGDEKPRPQEPTSTGVNRQST